MADNDASRSCHGAPSPPMIWIILEVGRDKMQRPRDQGQRVQGPSEVGIELGILILHTLSLDRGSPGQSELLTEEGVQLGLGELHHQELEAGVEEAGVPGLVTGHLGLPLAQPGHGVKQVSRRTTETDNIMFQCIEEYNSYRCILSALSTPVATSLHTKNWEQELASVK